MHFLVNDNFTEVEVEYSLLPEYWGKGYGSEIAENLLKKVEETKGMQRATAIIDPNNIASKKIVLKNGFTSCKLYEIDDGSPAEMFSKKVIYKGKNEEHNDNDLKTYLENMKKPWSVLYYRLVWQQLPQVTNCKVLDFGSGLGITANHLAKNNDVVAIEPDAGMIDMRICDNNYEQIIGNIEQLKEQDDNSFDVIICHNVFLNMRKNEKKYLENYVEFLNQMG